MANEEERMKGSFLPQKAEMPVLAGN